MMKKTAIVLFNLGGPDNLAAVEPFLYNLFSDAAIIRLPALFRQMLARLISRGRAKTAQGIYAKIGGRSPILENTQAQARALEKELAATGPVKCFVAMRYWHPFADETVREVQNFAPDEIILLPLYPQFSTTTTASSFRSWNKAARKAKLKIPTRRICCYPDEAGFIRSMAQSIHTAFQQASAHGKPRILFSAHGLPEKIVKAGDPYQFQCERTAQILANALSLSQSEWMLCYQSRVGPLQWIGPATEHEIERAGRDKVPVIVVPIAFVSEHSETIYEIDMLYRELADKEGVPYFAAVPTVGTSPDFIAGLAQLVRRAAESSCACLSSGDGILCPPEFSGCRQRIKDSA